MPQAAKSNGTASLATVALLGAAPLIKGENASSYDDLFNRICVTLQPRDCLEEIWIRDVVDLVWEMFRLRRLKAAAMTDQARSEIAGALRRHHAEGEALANEWAAGGDEAEQTLQAALGSSGLSMETLTMRAVAASFNLDRMQQIDRMLVSVEARRAAALREIDTHRGPLAQRLRLAIAQEEEAQRRIEAPLLAGEDSA